MDMNIFVHDNADFHAIFDNKLITNRVLHECCDSATKVLETSIDCFTVYDLNKCLKILDYEIYRNPNDEELHHCQEWINKIINQKANKRFIYTKKSDLESLIK